MKIKSNFISLDESQRIYELEFPVIALTGGIATGKSSVSSILRKKGIKVICADSLIKDIYKEQETLSFIQSISPKSVEKDTINFKTLRTEFFSSKELKELIEQFLYKNLKKFFLREASEILKAQPFIVYDIPLLFEKKLESLFDLIIVAYSPRETQFQRILMRDSNTEDMANKILDSQYDIELKKENAHIVIENLQDLSALEANVHHLIDEVFESEE